MSQKDQDLASIIDRAAVFIFKHGVEYEAELLETFPCHTFLKSSDPNHGMYQKRLMEYRNGTADTMRVSAEVIEPPPGSTKTLIERTAILISKKSSTVEERLRRCNLTNPRYKFLHRSDPFHAFYQQKLREYRSLKTDANVVDDDSDDGFDAALAANRDIILPKYISLSNFLQWEIPQGMTLSEFDTIKLTAMFVGWYGSEFWLGLHARAVPQLGFMNPSNGRFSKFTELTVAYSKVLTPPTNLIKELGNNAAYLEAIIDAFLQCLQWKSFDHYRWRQGGEQSLIDWHASVTKDFANKGQNHHQDLPPLPQKQSPPLLEEPNPKRQKLDVNGSALVPEDQFLAQHPVMFLFLIIGARLRSRFLFPTLMVVVKSLRSRCSRYRKAWLA
ncbi:probable splicing factor 3A subunit 1 isoform X2 [Capsella rubella]|uniref:probable splicing factor 3A subunit 1 isoform X2 n=1 Tax=Capsella rubella TaxID=81985 RepID=UPI000CD5162F|nr:probable splicing factor 3A subunit 1 isoform X2 [Capsella rubella]